MRVRRFNNAQDFLIANQHFLETEETINSLMLGLSLLNQKKNNDNTLYINITNKDIIVFAAIMMEGRDLIIYGDDSHPEAYLTTLVQYFQKQHILITGINGPKNSTLLLGKLMQKVLNKNYQIAYKMMVYKLIHVQFNPISTCQLRAASMSDIELISEWFYLFNKEVFNAENKDYAYAQAREKVEQEGIYILQNEVAVSMCSVSRATTHGISINYVYTPIDQRKHGYATEIVAKVSDLMLSNGYEFCTLFTDLDNPTSNNIYQKIGYKPIKEFNMIKF